MEIAKLALEYLKAFLSPQMITGIVIIFFFITFRLQIGELIKRISKINLPGGGNIDTPSQAEKAKEEPLTDNPPLPASESSTKTSSSNSTQSTGGKAQDLINSEHVNALLWEYKYLNYFLVQNSQKVLDWFIALPAGVTVSLFDTIWMQAIPQAEERAAILAALENHHLIQSNNGLLEITDKGKDYLKIRGPLPANVANPN